MDIGSILRDRYTLTALLGKGAVGTVYRGDDKQTDQTVTVKIIACDLAFEPDMFERFRREGEALPQLRHPNFVGYVDMFQLEDQHVIIMEYVAGGSLFQLTEQGPLPLDRARRIALELCDALTRAHDLNIVHRDLKLSDFGVARLVSEGNRPMRSDDSGQTIIEVAAFPQQTCQPILVLAASGQHMYIADWGDFWRSDDGSQTWTSAAAPGGYFNAAVADPSNPDIVYLGSTHAGVQKTTDGGNSWQPANAGLPAPAVNEIALDPQNPQTLYAATGQGAFVSVNGGQQWQPLPQGLGPNPIVYSPAADPNDPRRVLAATADGIFRLTSTGALPFVPSADTAPN